MVKQITLPSLAIIFLLISCKNETTKTYAIKDFRAALRPHLIKLVTRGIVTHYDSALKHMATDEELLQLTHAESPVLRSMAFGEILKRPFPNHLNLLMNNLDDTAFVPVDHGEFGIASLTVTDDLLQIFRWKTEAQKKETVDKVLTKHNYLQSAYRILEQLETKEKYYAAIRDMATRPRLLSDDGYESGFRDIEYALYALAKFKKREDVRIIKEKLLKNSWQMSSLSFRLMQEYPDTAYMDALQRYHRYEFYQFTGNRRGGFTGFCTSPADPEDFIRALSAQQSERSARLLDTLLTYLPQRKCFPDKENVLEFIMTQIWEYPAPAYTALRKKIKPKVDKTIKDQLSSQLDPIDIPPIAIDTSIAHIRWY